MERRYLSTEVRMAEPESRVIEGYALKFDKESNDLGGFREIITRDALSGADMEDVVAAFNHNYDKVLARTSAGTLQLSVDETGLKYRFEAPNTTAGNDLLEDIRSGNVSKSSFAFSLDKGGDSWEKRGDVVYRTITKFKRIVDVSPVVFPAYPDTDAAKRSLEAWQNDSQQPELLRLELFKLQLKQKSWQI